MNKDEGRARELLINKWMIPAYIFLGVAFLIFFRGFWDYKGRSSYRSCDSNEFILGWGTYSFTYPDLWKAYMESLVR